MRPATSNRPFILLGAGGHAKVVLDILTLSGLQVLGVISPELTTKKWSGINVLGTDDDEVLKYEPSAVFLANGVGFLPKGAATRVQVSERFSELGYDFPALIHPSSIVADSVEVNSGVQIMAGAVCQTGAVLGEYCVLNTRAVVDHDVNIGRDCQLAPNATLCGAVTLEKGVFVGAGAVVIQGVRVGGNSIIGAGSVVTRDVPIGTLVYGSSKRTEQRLNG